MNRPDPSQLVETAYRFFVDINPRFTDVDSQQHLNNVAIAQYYEEARSRMSLALFGRQVFANPDLLRLVVATSTVTYLREGLFPEPIKVGVVVRHVGSSSYGLSMALFQLERCLGVADSVMVHLGPSGAAPLPAAIRQRLETLLVAR